MSKGHAQPEMTAPAGSLRHLRYIAGGGIWRDGGTVTRRSVFAVAVKYLLLPVIGSRPV